MKTTYLLLLIGIALTSGCATKGARKVYAKPYYTPRETSPLNQNIADAPRTEPGRIMDPSAVTFAQVPSRIIYLPGEADTLGRTSPRQEVAYNLVPVDRIQEIQAQKTPEFTDRNPPPSNNNNAPVVRDIFPTGFANKDGSTSQGIARRLGVLGQSAPEKQRAETLLKGEEVLRWSVESGWVGFTIKTTTEVETPQKKTPPIPTIPEEAPHGKPPEMTPISGTSMKDEKKVDTTPQKPEKDGTGLDIEADAKP